MARFPFLFFLIFLLSFNIFAQIVTVKDANTNEILEMVSIYSKQPVAATSTNKFGKAELKSFVNSKNIQFNLLGYKKKTLSYKGIKNSKFIVLLQPIDIKLGEVIISATKWAQHTSDIPTKIVTINPKDVTFQNPQTTADLLNISGKVFIQKSQQGGGSPMIRGFATNRLLYSIDGVRMNTAIFRGGNIQDVIFLDSFIIESTEVFFGPGSVIYGSDAIGGVMSFKTIVPKSSNSNSINLKLNASTRYSSANNEKTVHFDINLGLKNLAFVTSLSFNDFGDLTMGSNGSRDYIKPFNVVTKNGNDIVIKNKNENLQTPSAYSQFNLMQKIMMRLNNNLEFDYGFHLSRISEYGRYDRHLRMRDGKPKYAEWNYGPQKWMMNFLEFDYKITNRFFNNASLKFALQNFEENRINRSLNKIIRNTKTELVDVYSVNLDLLKNFDNRNKLYYGFEYVLNNVSSTGIDKNIKTGQTEKSASRYPNSDWQSAAIYANYQYKFSEQYLLQAGLRYNYFRLNAKFDTTFYPFPFTNTQLSDDKITESIGFVYRPEKTWVISTNLSTAFRSPNVDDMGKIFDSAPGVVVIPNPKLKSEYAYNIDLGLAKVFNDKFKFDFSLYYTFLHNALVRRDFQFNGLDSIMYDGVLSKVQAIQNAAKANVYGIQIGFEGKFTDNLKFNINFNYQKGEEELDNGNVSPSRHAAPMFGNLSLDYKLNNFNFEFYSIYQGEVTFENLSFSEKDKTEIYAKDKNGNPYSPSWFTLNFKSSYKLNDNFNLFLGLENILDKRYKPYSSGIAAPGRNFIFSVKFNY
ncbi:MAG: TonB-dependent receptor [Ignavibacteriae bacterium]|nr:MAG: TonB-dependent receptor [Ignavibacteriota bacterium]